MIQIKITTNTVRKNIIVEENKTIREVLEENEIIYNNVPVYLDGTPLGFGDHDKTLKELGIKEKCLLSVVQKLDNAK